MGKMTVKALAEVNLDERFARCSTPSGAALAQAPGMRHKSA
jgi:ribosomal protein L12E/L44/L45/RPP1/RPP2